jgi:hypothetical protein
MKSRPSFGLLVVSWYLLTPPFVGGNPDIEAPLSQWDESAKFTSLNDCSDERDRQLQGVIQEAQEISAEYKESPDQYLRDIDEFSNIEQTVTGSKCVSSEDPGLQAGEHLHSSKAHSHHVSRVRRSRKAHRKPIRSRPSRSIAQ